MSSILNTYNRKKISFKKGKGSYLYSSKGKKYLDFVQGIAVNCLGHSNEYLIKELTRNKSEGKNKHRENDLEIAGNLIQYLREGRLSAEEITEELVRISKIA